MDNNTGRLIVTNAYSGSMVNTESYSTSVEKISEEEFIDLARKGDSHIGNPGIARRYHLPYNRKPIHLVPGDELAVVYIKGGQLPSSGQLPWNVHLSFEHIKIGSKTAEVSV